jgi:hypothetical protein
MQRVDMVLTGANASTPWKNADWMVKPFQLSIAVVASGGTAAFTVQYTYDDLMAGAPPAANVFNDATLNNATATGETTVNDPITGWRVTTGAGNSATLTIRAIQATF